MNEYVVENARGARITTVYAASVDQARKRARELLDRPGRRNVLLDWRADGEPIRDKATNEIHTTGEER